ncbi:hypothetical protein KKG71_02600 [Patescibacteria group bacterium]|nr:hypothetical protein [Patescibacteria group bacterium]
MKHKSTWQKRFLIGSIVGLALAVFLYPVVLPFLDYITYHYKVEGFFMGIVYYPIFFAENFFSSDMFSYFAYYFPFSDLQFIDRSQIYIVTKNPTFSQITSLGILIMGWYGFLFAFFRPLKNILYSFFLDCRHRIKEVLVSLILAVGLVNFFKLFLVPNALVCRNGPFGCEKGSGVNCWPSSFSWLDIFRHPCACECNNIIDVLLVLIIFFVLPFSGFYYLSKKVAVNFKWGKWVLVFIIAFVLFFAVAIYAEMSFITPLEILPLNKIFNLFQ